jgi:hypothetical protein
MLVVIIIIIVVFLKAKLRVSEFEEVIELFDKSDNIVMINNKIDDYIFNRESRSKQNIIHTIINTLINRKRSKFIIEMKKKLLNSVEQITIEIVEQEIENINNDISHYRIDLYQKLNNIAEFENQICINI